jgi:hypothetical protein
MNPSERIDQLIAELTDWRGKMFASIRKSILEADREIIEEWKWMGSPVWSRDGIIAVANAHKGKVKLTFSHGASLPDPDKLFNAGLEGNARRAIDFFEGDKINKRALKNLVRAAVDYNQIKLQKKAPAGTRSERTQSKKTRHRTQPRRRSLRDLPPSQRVQHLTLRRRQAAACFSLPGSVRLRRPPSTFRRTVSGYEPSITTVRHCRMTSPRGRRRPG